MNEFALANIVRVDFLTHKYALTTDVALAVGKSYYTKSGDVYSLVAAPDVDDIATYYEIVVDESYKLTDVATEATVEAFISEGAENELRVKNTIKAQNKFEDIVKGYNTTLTAATLIPEILALVDGGVATYTGVDPNKVFVKYEAPIIGMPVSRTPFTTKIYTADKDVDGEDKGYVCFEFLHSKGTPVSYSIVDGEFFVPQLVIRSRPKFGESPVTITHLTELPA